MEYSSNTTSTLFIMEFENTSGIDNILVHGEIEIPDPFLVNTVMTIFYVLVFLFGFSGNLFVIFVIFKNPEMSTATNIFLVNLSVADLLVLVVCLPIGLIELYSMDEWLLGDFMCEY